MAFLGIICINFFFIFRLSTQLRNFWFIPTFLMKSNFLKGEIKINNFLVSIESLVHFSSNKILIQNKSDCLLLAVLIKWNSKNWCHIYNTKQRNYRHIWLNNATCVMAKKTSKRKTYLRGLTWKLREIRNSYIGSMHPKCLLFFVLIPKVRWCLGNSRKWRESRAEN